MPATRLFAMVAVVIALVSGEFERAPWLVVAMLFALVDARLVETEYRRVLAKVRLELDLAKAALEAYLRRKR